MLASKNIYRACVYTRLSRDDGDKPESDSIANQKALIRDCGFGHERSCICFAQLFKKQGEQSTEGNPVCIYRPGASCIQRRHP